MYESITYETIMERMIAQAVKNNSDIDTREGSILYNALAPAAVELQNMYIELDNVLNESFADTQSRQYLIKRAAERGIKPEPSTKAILKAEFNQDVPIESRFTGGGLFYKIIEKISEGIFKLECETYGEEGNTYTGTLLPINTIEGLTKAEATEILIPGEDEEATEVFRKRYFNSLKSQSFGGNIADYKDKTISLSGVGGVKVYPAWNGGGTVKLVIIDSTYSAPSASLIESVQSSIDPVTNSGEGIGLAPIGHIVTVEGVEKTSIKIATTITYVPGWNWNTLEKAASEAVDKYFKELSESWDSESNLVVRISQIETRLLGLKGVLDIKDTKINDGTVNILLKENAIPVRGEMNG